MPYHIVGDGAFALTTHMMRPFPETGINPLEEMFNFRLSRARRIVDNVFGILTARFRCLRRAMHGKVLTSSFVVLACMALHNMLRRSEGRAYLGDQIAQETTPPEMRLPKTTHRNHTEAAKNMRQNLMTYFRSPLGQLPAHIES